MRRPLRHREVDALGAREAGEEGGGLRRGRSQLEVRRAGERERTRAEERAAEVRSPAAAAGDDAARRALERCVPAVDHTGGGEDT